MRTFIIGVVGVIIVAFASLFVPSYYSYSWGYANFEGIIGDAATSQTAKGYYSLVDSFGPIAYVIFGLTFVILLVYTILMLTKNSNLVPTWMLFIAAMLPIVNMIIGVILSKGEGQFVRVGSLVIGTGTNAGLSGWGFRYLQKP